MTFATKSPAFVTSWITHRCKCQRRYFYSKGCNTWVSGRNKKWSSKCDMWLAFQGEICKERKADKNGANKNKCKRYPEQLKHKTHIHRLTVVQCSPFVPLCLYRLTSWKVQISLAYIGLDLIIMSQGAVKSFVFNAIQTDQIDYSDHLEAW